jgi:hypothetical protein
VILAASRGNLKSVRAVDEQELVLIGKLHVHATVNV